MKVTLLGTGPPNNPDRFQSSALVEIGSDLLLFDAGGGAVHQLLQAGVDLSQIGPVFITHHHYEHINDLFAVIIASAMRGRERTLPIYGPPGTRLIVDALLNQVYAKDIRFRLEEDRNVRGHGHSWIQRPESIRDVAVHEVGAGVAAQGDGWRVIAGYVMHGDFPDAPDFDWRCLGYRIESQGEVITISGDTVPCPGISEPAREADLLVQCCIWSESDLTNNSALRYLTESVLPSTAQAGQIAAEAGVRRMVLTHMGASISHSGALAEVRQHYQEEVLVGSDLMVIQ